PPRRRPRADAREPARQAAHPRGRHRGPARARAHHDHRPGAGLQPLPAGPAGPGAGARAVTAVEEPGTATSFTAPKCIPEYFPPVSAAFEHVRATLEAPAALAGYGLLEPPVFEDTALSDRGVGESTVVVTKEMYTFGDRGDRSVT